MGDDDQYIRERIITDRTQGAGEQCSIYSARQQKPAPEQHITCILLVEDDPDVRPLIEHVLLGAGYSVDVAVGVSQARALLATGSYDLVLTDGRLPDGSGIEIADAAKARGIVAVIITGLAMQLGKDELGRHEYLLKPVRPAELLLAVRRYIGE